MSLFTEVVEGVLDLEDLEPWEITELCNDPIFRMICSYCARTGRTEEPEHEEPCHGGFDRDELGIDPEEDVAHA